MDIFLNDFSKAKESNLPAVNIAETPNEFNLELAVTGIKKKTVKVNIDNNTLTISNIKDEAIKERKDNFKRIEFNYTSFERSFQLPKTVDVDNIEATYEDGVLHVKLPKKEEAKAKEPRLIKVA
jgi:HSP20 family protein